MFSKLKILVKIAFMIYLAFDFKTTLTKIGFSDNPEKREKSLQTAAPNLKFIFTAEGSENTEKQLHSKYKEYHVIGEWFNLDKDSITEIINQFAGKSSIIYSELVEKINVANKEFNLSDLNGGFNGVELRLLEIFYTESSPYNLNYLANNLFLSIPQTMKILNTLRKDKILNYKKTKNLLYVKVIWNLVKYQSTIQVSPSDNLLA